MRVLVVGINYWPEETGIAPFNTWRCEYLASCGHDVTMCTSFPYYPEWRIADEYRGRMWQRETRNGVEIVRSWMWVPSHPTSLTRGLFEATFLASSLISALGTKKPDVLLMVSPPLGLGITARLLSRWWKIPYVFHVEDLQPDAAADLGMLPGPLIRILLRLEKSAYRHAALVSTLTNGMQERIVRKGIPDAKVVVFSHAADETLFAIRNNHDGSRFRAEFGLADSFLVVHCGNMGVKQGLEVVLAAADRTRANPKIRYLLVGDGAVRDTLKARAAEINLRNLQILPLQAREMFRDMLVATDVSLVTQQKSVSDIVFPSKVVTLLAAGCPVIASVNAESQVARAVRDSGGGLIVSAEDGDLLANAIFQLQADPEARARMSVSGQQYARQRWGGEHIMGVMDTHLRRIVANNGGALQQAKATSQRVDELAAHEVSAGSHIDVK